MEIQNIGEKKLFLDAILAEYTAMKSESVHKLQIQFTLITLYVTVFGVLMSLCIDENVVSSNTPLTSPYFFCLIIPAVAICISVIWLDQVYRQIKIAVYISYLEKKINQIVGVDNNVHSSAVFWEHWIRNNMADKGKFNVSQSFYYICLGIFLLCPIVSYLLGAYMMGWQLLPLLVPTCITSVGYIAFVLFVLVYVKRILAFNDLAK